MTTFASNELASSAIAGRPVLHGVAIGIVTVVAVAAFILRRSRRSRRSVPRRDSHDPAARPSSPSGSAE